MTLYDTEFLIELSGDKGKPKKAAAEAFLATRTGHNYISRVTWSEFAEGCEHEAQADRETRRFRILEITPRVAWIASRIARNLDRRGLPIGDNDVWIAAAAMTYGLEVVSRNLRHMGKVRGLTVLPH